MPTFEHPPEWWVSLANLTRWLYWPAISALVAGAAWWRTGTLADRARREDRRKDATFILAAAILLEAAVQPYRKSVMDSRADTADKKGSFEAAKKTAILMAVAKRIAEVKVTDFPHPEALARFLSAEIKLRRIEIVGDKVINGSIDDVEELTPAIIGLQSDIIYLVATARSMTDAKIEYTHEKYLTPLEVA